MTMSATRNRFKQANAPQQVSDDTMCMGRELS